MKKSTRLLSVLLAFVMVISAFAATFAASAADVYKPTYSEDVTEEDITLLIGDINTLLEKNVFTGAAIENIYKALPSLSAILNLGGSSTASNKAAFYKQTNPERFADLPDGDIIPDEVDENGNVVKEGTLTVFFKEHPIVCSSAADFQAELNTVIDTVVVQNLLQTVLFAFVFDPTSLAAVKDLGVGLDEICEVLGVEQPKTANAVLGFDTYSPDVEGTRTYLKNIVAAVFPDTANSVLALIPRLLTDENNAKLYDGCSKILQGVGVAFNTLSGTLESLGVDIAAATESLSKVINIFLALPTVGEDAEKRLDIEGSVSVLAEKLTNGILTIQFSDRPENPSGGAMVAVNFRAMQLDRVINAESNADVLKIIYDYLYDNLIADETNNSLVKFALESNLIESALGIQIPADTKAFLLKALGMSNLELADNLVVMAANAAGRQLPEEPTTEEPTTQEPTTQEPTTTPSGGSGNTGDDQTTKPAGGAETTTASSQNGNANQNANIPKTGGAATIGFSALSLAAGAAFITLVARKRK